MSKDFTKLANEGLLKLQPYQPGKPIAELQRESGIKEIIKLASNENPLGASPRAIAAAKSAVDTAPFYPDGSGYDLKQAISKKLKVAPEQITLGNGSDNILQLAAQTFVSPGQEIIISDYAFATFTIITHLVGATPIIVPTKNWTHNLDAMAEAVTDKSKLIFIANPNNPTGTWVDEISLISFLNKIPEYIIVVLDEAYYDYMQEETYPDSIQLQQDYPNIITTRTFSKMHGLAGLRLGFGISNPQIGELLNRARLPFNVNTPAQAAGIAALHDVDHVQNSLNMNKIGMLQLEKAFSKMGLNYIPSNCNFLTVDIDQDCMKIYKALLEKGIIVRPMANYNMPTFLRITIGTHHENERLLEALKEILT